MRRALAFGVLWVIASGGAIVASGCYGRNCEGGFETFGADTSQGLMLDENTWTSGPLDGPWLPFPRQRFYFFDIKALGGRRPMIIQPFISAAPRPLQSNDDFIPGSGNLAKIKNPGPNHVEIWNDSCSDYFLHLTVEAPPFPPATDAGVTPDAAIDLDASTDDASDGN